jgi:hypothetical protein
MQPETIGTIFTLCVCGGLGSFLARAVSMPVRLYVWSFLVLAIVGGAFVGVHTWLPSVLGVGIRLNVAIVSCAVGMSIALMVRTGRRRRLSGAAA